MKITRLAILGTCLLLLALSCSKKDIDPEAKECGDELRTILSISTAENWKFFSPGHSETNALYKTSYFAEDGKANFILRTQTANVCPNEAAEIGTQIITNKDVPDMTLTYNVMEDGISGKVDMPVTTQSNSVRNGNNVYALRGPGEKAGELLYEAICSFPTQGSWSADSTFFFGALSSYYMSMNAKKFE